jgi:predicted RNase H-like nuclease
MCKRSKASNDGSSVLRESRRAPSSASLAEAQSAELSSERMLRRLEPGTHPTATDRAGQADAPNVTQTLERITGQICPRQSAAKVSRYGAGPDSQRLESQGPPAHDRQDTREELKRLGAELKPLEQQAKSHRRTIISNWPTELSARPRS